MKLFYAFISLSFFAVLAHGQTRIGGSDLLEPHFADALTEYAESRDLSLSADFAGSYPGIEGLKRGELDMAVIAVPVGGEMPDESYRAVKIASKVLAVAVPADNPLNQITLEQLGAIFGSAEGTVIGRWGELGLSGEWASRSIVARTVSRAEHTLTLDLFRHQVLESRALKGNVAEASDLESIRRSFQEDGSGIALLDRVPSDQNGMKILPIARSQTDFAHGPTPEAVANENYPLYLPLYLVFSPEKAAELKEFLRFAASEEAATALESSNLIPLPDQKRQRLYLEFERL